MTDELAAKIAQVSTGKIDGQALSDLRDTFFPGWWVDADSPISSEPAMYGVAAEPPERLALARLCKPDHIDIHVVPTALPASAGLASTGWSA